VKRSARRRAWIAFLLVATAGCRGPVADGGRLDLSRWDPAHGGVIALGGAWELYWGQLLEPADFAAAPLADGWFSMPGYWNGITVAGEPVGGSGHATFRLRVDLGEARSDLALRLEDAASAYCLYADGVLVAKNGVVGESPQQSLPQFRPVVAAIDGSPSSLELVLQVSNYHRRKGGPNNVILLGRSRAVWFRHNLLVAADVALFGCLVFMALYHLVLYFFRRSARTYAIFAVLCFAWGIHTPVLGASGNTLALLFDDFPWVLQLKGEQISLTWGVAAILIHFVALYPAELAPRAARISAALATGISALILVLPTRLADLTVIVTELSAVFVVVYSIAGCALAVRRGRPGAWVTLIGCVVLAGAGINDLLHDQGVIHTLFISHAGVLFFCVSQAMVLGTNLQRAYAGLERTLEVERELETQRQREAEARLQAETERLAKLRYQLNPHFLFNSLTSIRGAILLDREAARRMVSDLAALLRRALSLGARDQITVREEVELLETYLRIERARLGDQLRAEVDCQEGLGAESIPTLVLQPLAENAIKHGRKSSAHPLVVRVTLRRHAEHLHVCIANTGTWKEPEDAGPQAQGYGLGIIRERLERIYAGRQALTIATEDGWVRVELKLPRT
jgi:two-component sensor histidine kinase